MPRQEKNPLHRLDEETAMAGKYHVKVAAQSFYLEEQSVPEQDHYVFAYTITIRNEGTVPARLLSRHWIITDSNGKVEEVRGKGVVGEQPYLRPGEGFQYTSGAIITTPVGSMQGSYQLIADDGVAFAAPIPVFTLSAPRTLH
jgi:ApaG protein